jgi:hypothetical protein
MKILIGVMDNNRIDVGSRVIGIDEVDFWHPGRGSKTFEALQPGEQNLFELHDAQTEERQKRACA